MKFFVLLILAASSAHAADTQLQCASNSVSRGGVRLNVIETAGKVRGNLIFGTTVSGTMYQLSPTKEGYKGDRGGKFSLELRISRKPSRNKYVEGYAAQLEATYPDLHETSGVGRVLTTARDQFTCGKQIRSYR